VRADAKLFYLCALMIFSMAGYPY